MTTKAIASSPIPGASQDQNNRRQLLWGRVLAGCLLMAAALLVWVQEYEYQEKERLERSNHDDDVWFDCKIDQLKLELYQAPDLIIAGAAKSGTTTLARLMDDHPLVIQTKKHWEISFFNQQIHPREFEPLLDESTDPRKRDDILCELRKRYNHQWPDLAAAQQQQDNGEKRVYTFDKTPDYLYPSRVPALVQTLFPNATQRPKIVVLLRNPIDRAYSHYRMGQRMIREEHVSFEEFIQRETTLLRELGLSNFFLNSTTTTTTTTNSPPKGLSLDQLYDQVSDQLQGHNYLTRGLYALQLERWFRHGLGPQMLILPYSQLASNPQQVYSTILEFVGMPAHSLSHELQTTKFNYNPVFQAESLNNSTRQQLAQFYQQPNQDLLELLQKYNHKSQEYHWQELWG